MAARRARLGRTTNDRIVIILLAGLGMLGLLWMRCVWLQVIHAEHLARLAEQQHRATERRLAVRGRILDRLGRPLAMSLPAPSVFADARRVAAKPEMAHRLAELLGRDASELERRLEQDKGFVWMARQVDPGVQPTLLTLRSAGIGMREEMRRLYPHGSLAGHVLGFVDVDHRGLEGVELAFETALRGQDGWRTTLRDAKGDLLLGPWTQEAEALPGHDLVLTLDGVVQQAAEEVLAWGLEEYHAQAGSIIVMEPHRGAILAMANRPGFDPNAFQLASPDARRNRAVTDVFEPGSVFKMVAAAALLEEQRITADDEIFCEQGEFATAGRHILHDHHPYGTLSFEDVIRLSSNIGIAKAAQRLTPEELYYYIHAFGLGQRTGIDLPGEVSGLLTPPAKWSKLSAFIIPMGQEIAITPIQLAVITAAIANGGMRVVPHVVVRAQTREGEVVRSWEPPAPTRILSPETAAELQRMLVRVVESGTGQRARVQGLTVAGKTGTAQKLEPNGRYSHSRFVASFAGFGPVPDSRFVAVVSVDEPQPTYYGGQVAAPMWQRLVERLASYLELKRLPALVRASPRGGIAQRAA